MPASKWPCRDQSRGRQINRCRRGLIYSAPQSPLYSQHSVFFFFTYVSPLSSRLDQTLPLNRLTGGLSNILRQESNHLSVSVFFFVRFFFVLSPVILSSTPPLASASPRGHLSVLMSFNQPFVGHCRLFST